LQDRRTQRPDQRVAQHALADRQRPRRPSRRACQRSLVFPASNLSGLALADLAIVVLAQIMPPALTKLGSIVITATWNYWTSHRFVYRR
jgi:putative flippase GtrA